MKAVLCAAIVVLTAFTSCLLAEEECSEWDKDLQGLIDQCEECQKVFTDKDEIQQCYYQTNDTSSSSSSSSSSSEEGGTGTPKAEGTENPEKEGTENPAEEVTEVPEEDVTMSPEEKEEYITSYIEIVMEGFKGGEAKKTVIEKELRECLVAEMEKNENEEPCHRIVFKKHCKEAEAKFKEHDECPKLKICIDFEKRRRR